MPRPTRRHVLAATATAAAALAFAPAPDAARPGKLHLAVNQYPWITYFQRDGRDHAREVEQAIAQSAAAGLDGYEPLAASPADLHALAPLLKKHGLEMRSLYVNSTLHDEARAERSIAEVLAIADAARGMGCRIVVTNPSPIRWGGPEDKTDAQLEAQARALGRLGKALADRGMTLAYHNHDPELRNAAREFHHMMLATDPAHVTLCLDAHWIYRGSGNSQVALFDVLKLYGRRITELHLRQSAKGTWTEAFGDGDIDYGRLARELEALKVRPHLVLEQAVEKGTPRTMDGLAAHRASTVYARRTFASLA